MDKRNISISSEYSAQGRNHSKSPGLIRLLSRSSIMRNIGEQNCIVDYGCGKLRHFDLLIKLANEYYLVDTKEQLTRVHTESGLSFDFNEYIENNSNGSICKIFNNKEFEKISLKADIVFSIAVADVIPLNDYSKIIADSYTKLKRGSYFVLVVPRNDTSILRRCTQENLYEEGHLFPRGKYFTYIRNYRDPKPLIDKFEETGFSIIEDLSIFSQICMIFKKN